MLADCKRIGADERTRGRVWTDNCQWASECGADAIVMATHGRTGLGRGLIGSVADRMLQASRVPELLLRPTLRQVDRIETILVPLDGSLGAAFALSTVAPFARVSGATVLLLRASAPPAVWFDDPGLGAGFEEQGAAVCAMHRGAPQADRLERDWVRSQRPASGCDGQLC